jgi:hypothetical protein
MVLFCPKQRGAATKNNLEQPKRKFVYKMKLSSLPPPSRGKNPVGVPIWCHQSIAVIWLDVK